MFTFSVITPTLGHDDLRDLLHSLNEQSGLGTDFQIEHWIVIDHADQTLYKKRTYTLLNEIMASPHIQRRVLEVPFASGEDGYKGHRIYAAVSQWAQGNYTCLLDEDNWYDPHHLQTFFQIIRRSPHLEWLYSFRKIYSDQKRFLCEDMCESLGHFHPVYYHPSSHLIDTNCYCIQTTLFQKIAWIWNRPAHYNDQDPDRVFGTYLMTHHLQYHATQKCTLHYRLHPEGTQGVVSKDLFLQGNQWMKERYGEEGIWKRPYFYLVHFDPTHTQQLLQRIYSSSSSPLSPSTPSSLSTISFQQWQLNLMDGMREDRCILNAYTSRFIPSNSIVWHHMCFPQELPTHILQRSDLYKVLYTIESPNIRHQPQWDLRFLQERFDLCVTYWKDLIEKSEATNSPLSILYYPFLHRCTDVKRELMELAEEAKLPSACILLENRELCDTYSINGTILHAQDAKRAQIVREIAKVMKVVCYGKSWEPLRADGNPRIEVKETPSRFLNADKTVDYYGKHLFSIILENCDATGYVSEKLYDAWMAGSIPIYMGNVDENLRRFMGDDLPLSEMMISVSINDFTGVEIEKIANKLSDLYVDEIEAYQRKIEKYKEKILEKVGVLRYNQFVKETIHTIQQQI